MSKREEKVDNSTCGLGPYTDLFEMLKAIVKKNIKWGLKVYSEDIAMDVILYLYENNLPLEYTKETWKILDKCRSHTKYETNKSKSRSLRLNMIEDLVSEESINYNELEETFNTFLDTIIIPNHKLIFKGLWEGKKNYEIADILGIDKNNISLILKKYKNKSKILL